MSSPYRHSNIEIRLHSEYLQVLSLKQQKPTEASTKNIKCQKYKAAFGISDAKNRNSNVQVEELRAQQSLLPQQPQCSSYPADLHVLTLTYNSHKWENTKCSRTLSIAISWRSRRHSFCTRLGAWAESLPRLVGPSSTQHSQTHLCHLLSGPCPGHFWLYQTWMSAESLRGLYSIGKGNYFHFLETNKKKIYKISADSRNRNDTS